MSKQTAFYPRLAALTDQWMDLFGYLAPSLVTDTLEEYRAVRETVGLMDFSMLRKIDLRGPGTVEFLNSLITRDLRQLRPGRIAYGALTDEHGKMIDDCTASVFGPEKVRFCGANDRDFELFSERAVGTSVDVRHFTDEMPHLCVQGPASRELLQPLCDQDLSNDAFPYYTFRDEVSVAGIPVFMTRLGYTAELGYELWVTRDRAFELFDTLVEAGEPAGMRLVGMDALDLLRIEGGFIIGGIEYDSSVSPYECGLGWAIDLDKGSFLGSEALALDKERTDVRLGSVVLDSGGAAASGARLAVDGEDVGYVTQAVTSPYLGGRTLGLAKLRQPNNAVGTKVIAMPADAAPGDVVAGEVVRHPVYDPERRRAKEKL
jgi:glycine cleavage system T protein (aminomethyltransferase)